MTRTEARHYLQSKPQYSHCANCGWGYCGCEADNQEIERARRKVAVLLLRLVRQDTPGPLDDSDLALVESFIG